MAWPKVTQRAEPVLGLCGVPSKVWGAGVDSPAVGIAPRRPWLLLCPAGIPSIPSCQPLPTLACGGGQEVTGFGVPGASFGKELLAWPDSLPLRGRLGKGLWVAGWRAWQAEVGVETAELWPQVPGESCGRPRSAGCLGPSPKPKAQE